MLLFSLPFFSSDQSSLNPAGPMASHIEHTFSLIFWITGTVYILTIAFLLFSVTKQRSTRRDMPEPMGENQQSDRIANKAVLSSIIATAALLFLMMGSSFLTSKAIGDIAPPKPLTINVYAHQWWWQINYPTPEVYRTVDTANEIHLPVGVPIRIHGTSRDVIHSFWAPNINGKRDLMPGYETDFVLQVDKPGIYRGQCAEFCGDQHAHMAFSIIAESYAQYSLWLDTQAKPALTPTTPSALHGEQVFETHACVMCHTIRGTTASSRVGPDLTHVASRAAIAGGTLPNTIGNLAGWVSNAQSIKPGVRMPPNPMSGQDLQDLLAYLESLR